MNRKINWRRIKRAFTSAIAVGAVAMAINSAGCTDNGSAPTTAVLVTPDGYVYYAYYPDDLSVSSYYWVDDWDYAGLYAVNTAGPVTTVADAVRALARGEDVCGSAAVVTARTRTAVCTGGPTESRGGATIVFNNCQTAGGGLINGTVDISSSGSASSAVCTGTTMVTTNHTTTITNLSYIGPNGVKAVIPQQTDTGTNTYTPGSAPAAISLSTTGQLQTYGPGGALISDTSYTGNPTISFAGSTSSYTVNGSVSTTNNLLNTGATYTLTDLTRVGTCCRPVGGTVQASNSAGASNTYTFGPACGDITLDGVIGTNIPECF